VGTHYWCSEVSGSSLRPEAGYPGCCLPSSSWVPQRNFRELAQVTSRPLPCKCFLTLLLFYGSTALLLDLGRFFSFLILYRIGRTPWTGDQPVARLLPTHRTTQTQNKRAQTSTPRVGFEPTIPVFEGAKTVHASECAATVIGIFWPINH
jgi:hypothetical protein